MTQRKSTIIITHDVERGKLTAALDGQVNGPNVIIACSNMIIQIASGKVQYNKDQTVFQAKSFDDRIKTDKGD